MSTVGHGMRLAVGTLTVLPVAPPQRLDRSVAAVAMVAAPVAVLPLAAIALMVVLGGDRAGLPPLVTATLAVATVVLGSGALHVDGLADTADGLAVPGGADRRLEVMRRGDVGPVGALSLVLVLLLQVGALAGLVDGQGAVAAGTALVVGVVASRAVLALLCLRGVGAARGDGLGATVAGSVPWYAAAGSTGLVGGVAWLVLGGAGVLALVVSMAAAGALLLACRRTLGGVTGDVLGAAVEVAFAAYLVGVAGQW